MKLTVTATRKIWMHISYRYTFLSLCFHSKSKLESVNFEQHSCLEMFIFTYLWLLSALGKGNICFFWPSRRSSHWPMVFPPCILLLAEKAAELQVTLFYLSVQALVSAHSWAIIRLPCFILKVLPQFPAGCQLLASSERLKAVHLFRDWQVGQWVKKPINWQREA